MAIRLFICRWSERPDGDGIEIVDPISLYFEGGGTVSAPTVSMNYFANMGVNNRPAKDILIKAIRGNLTEAEWTTLGSLPNVFAVPPSMYSATTASFKNPVKTKIYNVLDSLAIPRSTFDTAITFGEFLQNVLISLGGDNTSFGQWAALDSEWA